MVNIEKVENGYIIKTLSDSKTYIFASLAESFLSISDFFDEENILVEMFKISEEERLTQEKNEQQRDDNIVS